ncbi:unnamed protein product, partial [Didymodactylos carnosus]
GMFAGFVITNTVARDIPSTTSTSSHPQDTGTCDSSLMMGALK